MKSKRSTNIKRVLSVFLVGLSLTFLTNPSYASEETQEESTKMEVQNPSDEQQKLNTENYENLKERFLISSAVDIGSTAYIISSGIGYEANPLGFAGSTVVKTFLYFYAENQKDKNSEEGLKNAERIMKTSSALISGASLNNLLIIAGVTNPVSLILGIVFAGTLM